MNKIHFIGYSAVHPADFVYDVEAGYDAYLLILTSTPAEFIINGELKEFPANSAILYPPHTPVYYRACSETYGNDWLRFHADDTYITEFPIQGRPFSVSDPEYCHNLIKLLTWESTFASSNSDLIISDLLRVLFTKLYEDASNHSDSSHTPMLLNLRKAILNSPQLPWNVGQMAAQLHISAGYLQILYKKTFGISCMDDVINSRVRFAKEQLLYTTRTIREISDLCGYNNVEHFCRQFRQSTGYTPGQFRKSVASDSKNGSPHYTMVDKDGQNVSSGPK